MGFWQTGYYEFHEPAGLEGILTLSRPIKHVCKICHAEFDSLNDLSSHRFDRHPLHRPALIIHGCEVGSTPLRITEALKSADIEISSETEEARLNGAAIKSPDRVCEILAESWHGVVIVELSSQGVWANYRLLFDIASESDLSGVDASFVEMARGRRLDNRAIEAFIDRSFNYKTARTYCDGICEYLYGILSKERRADSSLPYEKYREKFSRAADILKEYRQPLGRIIGAIVAFHFNQFDKAHQLGGACRIGGVGRRFLEWIEGAPVNQQSEVSEAANSAYDYMLTDWETERVIRVCTTEPDTVGSHLRDVIALLGQDIPEVDRTKLWILASESCRMLNDYASAAKYARNLLNSPSFGAWAEEINRTSKQKEVTI